MQNNQGFSRAPTVEEIYEKLYPPAVRIKGIADEDKLDRLYEHGENIAPLLNGMEESLLKSLSNKDSGSTNVIDALHKDVLRVAMHMMRQGFEDGPLTLAGVGLRVAAAVIDRGCSDSNASLALRIFNEYDERVEAYLEEDDEDVDFKGDMNFSAHEGAAQSTDCLLADSGLNPFVEFELETAGHKLTALAGIRPGTKIAGLFHQVAVNYLVAQAENAMSFYAIIIMACHKSFTNSATCPAGLDILGRSYLEAATQAEKRADQLNNKKDKEERQGIFYDLITLHTDIVIGYSDVPTLVDQAENFCRKHWKGLKAINADDALNYLAEIELTLQKLKIDDDNSEGVLKLKALVSSLKEEGSLPSADFRKAQIAAYNLADYKFPTLARH